MSDLCQRCGIEPRKQKERYCSKCGASIRAEARRRAWEENPMPFRGFTESRGRSARNIDHGPKYEGSDEE